MVGIARVRRLERRRERTKVTTCACARRQHRACHIDGACQGTTRTRAQRSAAVHGMPRASEPRGKGGAWRQTRSAGLGRAMQLAVIL